jgi:hypothetical protein
VNGRVMNINVEGRRGRGRRKKKLIGCVKQSMRKMDASDVMSTDRGELKKSSQLN